MQNSLAQQIPKAGGAIPDCPGLLLALCHSEVASRELWDRRAQLGMTSQGCWRWLQAAPAGTSRPEPGARWGQLWWEDVPGFRDLGKAPRPGRQGDALWGCSSNILILQWDNEQKGSKQLHGGSSVPATACPTFHGVGLTWELPQTLPQSHYSSPGSQG